MKHPPPVLTKVGLPTPRGRLTKTSSYRVEWAAPTSEIGELFHCPQRLGLAVGIGPILATQYLVLYRIKTYGCHEPAEAIHYINVHIEITIETMI
jgi:hypothetical protein